jgi:hypothetical protein
MMTSETFVRQALVNGMVELMSTITMGRGFNTQPFVTQNPVGIQGREEDYILLVMPSTESVVEVGVGGTHEMELIIDLYGYAQTKDGNPVTRLNLLIQDVRNVLSKNIGDLSTVADRGLAFRLGDLETDEGVLAHGGQAAFVQSTHFVYKNGDTW